MSKIIYIAGLPHSGSTLLTMLLGSHPEMFGVGEIQKLIDPKTRNGALNKIERARCTCGSPTKDCSYWRDVMREIEQNERTSYGEHYRFLMNSANALRGREVAVVDSTKTLEALGQLLKEVEAGRVEGIRFDDVLILHVVKDVRTYLHSSRKRYGVAKWNLGRLYWYAQQWRKQNMKIQDFVKRNGLKSRVVSYERLCFEPERELVAVCDLAGVGYSGGMLGMDASQSHIGLGNPMRADPKKSSRIVYDDGWFCDFGVNLVYLLSRKCRNFNLNTRRNG